MKKIIKKKKTNNHTFLLVLGIIAVILLGIGYAEVANVELNVEGSASMYPESGIIITEISYLSGYNSDPDEQVFDDPHGTLMKSKIVLNNDYASHITYRVKFYNGTDEVGTYDRAIYSVEMGYDNPDIVFDVTGMRTGDTINPGETRELTITFKYNSSIPSINNNVLNSLINFKFNIREPVAKIGNTKFYSLTDAINSVTDSNQVEIELLKDTEGVFTINNGRNIKIDLGGNTITSTGNQIFVNNGTFYVTNGTLKSNAGKSVVDNNENAHIVIDGVRIEATGIRQAIWNKGDAEIRGDSYFTSTTNQRATVHNAGGTMRIISGRFESSAHSAVYNENGSLYIGTSDGVAHHDAPIMIGNSYGIQSGKTYSFYDGIAKGRSGGVNNQTHARSDMEPNCDLASRTEIINDHEYKVLYPAVVVTVTFNPNGGSVSERTRVVEQGAEIYTLPFPTRNGYDFDGWFTSQSGGEKISTDTIVQDTVTYYAHWSKSTDVAEMNGVTYDTIQAAINAAPSNTPTTITVLKDATESLSVNSDKEITLDLNDHTLKNNGNYPAILNHGDLTVTGGLVTANAAHAAINQESGTLNVNARITVNTERQAIYITGGYVHIYGDSYLTSSAVETTSNTTTLRSTVQCMENCTLLITSGTIIGNKQQAITNIGNMTIGTKDGSASQSSPVIRGEKMGILNTGTFNFYDGIVQGKDEAINGNVTDTETTLDDGTVTVNGKIYLTKYNS